LKKWRRPLGRVHTALCLGGEASGRRSVYARGSRQTRQVVYLRKLKKKVICSPSAKASEDRMEVSTHAIGKEILSLLQPSRRGYLLDIVGKKLEL